MEITIFLLIHYVHNYCYHHHNCSYNPTSSPTSTQHVVVNVNIIGISTPKVSCLHPVHNYLPKRFNCLYYSLILLIFVITIIEVIHLFLFSNHSYFVVITLIF